MMEPRALGPVTLAGDVVSLDPLRPGDAQSLFEATSGVDWTWFLGPLKSLDAVSARISEGLEAERRNEAFAFAVRMKEGGRMIGSTSYLAVNQKHRRVEIGSTWYQPSHQGTAVNPECKYLLLKHAFEDWGAVRVQFVTDVNNIHSQRAIAKLGAKVEGRMRNYGIRQDGSLRDVILYSITAAEWNGVRSSLALRISSLIHSSPTTKS